MAFNTHTHTKKTEVLPAKQSIQCEFKSELSLQGQETCASKGFTLYVGDLGSERTAVPCDLTCRVLSRDKGLGAERLSARYPAGNTYQAALQVWQTNKPKLQPFI